MNRLAMEVFVVAMVKAQGGGLQNSVPLRMYLVVSLSCFYAGASQYEALKHGASGEQRLGKSVKMLAGMIWASLLP